MNQPYPPARKPLVSIVIPTYNRATDLERALKSVMAQTYAEWECWVIDNYSTDETEEVICNFNDARIQWLKIHNQGVIARSRNLGIQNAQGQYIAFLDSDDWWFPQKLERAVGYFDQGADLVYHDLWCVKRTKQRYYRKKVSSRALSMPVYDDLIFNGNALANSSVLIRTELIRKLGGLSEDPQLIATEDFDCWLRAAQLSHRFFYIPEVLGYYWIGAHNESHPTRALVYLKRLQTLYFMEYITHADREMPCWWNYAFGRAHYLVGQQTEAKRWLKKVVHCSSSGSMKSKARFMLWMIGWYENR